MFICWLMIHLCCFSNYMMMWATGKSAWILEQFESCCVLTVKLTSFFGLLERGLIIEGWTTQMSMTFFFFVYNYTESVSPLGELFLLIKCITFFWRPSIYRTQAPYRNISQARNLPPEPHIQKTPEKSSTHLVPVWLQILVFLIVSGLLYLVFMNMESAEPVKRLT